MGSGGIARQNEDACTDDAADTKRDKACNLGSPGTDPNSPSFASA
jgi:hypothetical protein